MRDVFQVFSTVRTTLLERKVTGEAVIVQLDTECEEMILYPPIIFALLSTDNAFHFVNSENELKEVGRGSPVVGQLQG